MKKMDFQKAVGLINKAKRVLLTTHTRPDGDACGCIAAISETLTAIGKDVQILLLSELPSWYEFLFEQKPPNSIKSVKSAKSAIKCSDLIVIVDTDTYNQLPGLDKYLKKLKTKNLKLKTPVLVIDHHTTPESSVEDRIGGDVRLVDNSAAATALIVFDLLKYASWPRPLRQERGWPITKKIAEALFVAVSTDTGWFQFDNTDSKTLRVCAELIDAGANPSLLHRNLYQNFSPQRFKLMVAMLNTLELYRLVNGKWKLVTTKISKISEIRDKIPLFATQHLTQENFKQTDAKLSDTENLIDECRRISSVQASALFTELPDGRVKVALRTQRSNLDVSKIAEKFGGGGHKMAAGATLPGPIENAKKLVLAEMAKQLKQST